MFGNASATWPDWKPALAALILLVAGACAPKVPGDDVSALAPSDDMASPAPEREAPGQGIGSDPSAGDSEPAGVDIATSGRVAYLDPATGKLTSEPPEGGGGILVPQEVLDSIGSFHDNLEITTLEDGTIIATRPGGFKTAVVAVVGEDGTVTTKHVSPTAPADEATRAEDPAEQGEEVDDDR